MENDGYSKAVRVGGEVLVLHCWVCGTANSVNLELCGPDKLAHMICGNSKCKASMFLVNELTVDHEIRKVTTTTTALTAPFAVLARFWRSRKHKRLMDLVSANTEHRDIQLSDQTFASHRKQR
jgi:hypothetical protein